MSQVNEGMAGASADSPVQTPDDLVTYAGQDPVANQAQTYENLNFTELRSAPSRLEAFFTRLFSRFVREVEETFDGLFDTIEAQADELDANVDRLITIGQNKKIEAQDEIAALSRRIASIDGEIERTLQLGKRAEGLQNYVRAARSGQK